MTILGLLLVVNALLHGVVVGRFGITGNRPPALFGVAYAALAVAVFGGWTYAVPATLIVTSVGLAGLVLNFRSLQHDATVEKVILVVGVAIVACAVYLLIA
ncbi:hypothetical protein [Salsipaludibacter albus]|uniref:hypothetical protein n=1 Tax=Salsipaludibacter albus TaxID=2849650 RepID=UPI001EE4D748|nr:hypothetical protein [Salsipaludibacter albus]MBY5163723.1 hypothetical protein [Salsipaludibacter albus]